MGTPVRVLTHTERASEVKQALKKTVETLNGRLADTPGCIREMEADVGVGMAGASARITLSIDEGKFAAKWLLWANEPGSDEGDALRRAEKKINDKLKDLKGKVASFHQEFISPPVPRRTYATLIVAVNEEISWDVGDLSAEERRERLAAALRLLGDDPKSINISHLANLFGVSRDTIYRDLRKLGVSR